MNWNIERLFNYSTPCINFLSGLLNIAIKIAIPINTNPIVENTVVYFSNHSATVNASPESPCPPVNEAILPPT